jgi:hypothetical protein
MKPVDVLYVPASARTFDECERRRVAGIHDLQALVGGYVEEVHVPGRPGVVMFGDEEGLLHDRPANVLAALALTRYGAAAGTPLYQTIVGDVLFIGYDAEGNELDVPEAFVSELAEVLPRKPA